MSELKELRNKINHLDGEILSLLEQRMLLSKEVGNVKLQDGSSIFVPAREKEILKKLEEETPGNIKYGIANIWKSVMRFSRKLQYDIHLVNDKEWKMDKEIEKAINNTSLIQNVAYGGKNGSYSQIAAQSMYPDSKLFPSVTFEEGCRKLARGEVDAVVIPIENTTAGIVDASYDLALKYGFYIHKCLSMHIQNALIAKKGTNVQDIKKVYSHSQPLAQCSDIISQYDWEGVSYENTAYAVEDAAKTEQEGVAAIASKQIAVLHGLDILMDNVCNRDCNQTRFISLTKEWMLLPDAKTISMLIKLPHETGTLAAMLNIIGDSGFNLSKIQSRPIPDKPWEYIFYVNIECDFGDKRLPSVLYQLEKELPYLHVIGWYNEEQLFDF